MLGVWRHVGQGDFCLGSGIGQRGRGRIDQPLGRHQSQTPTAPNLDPSRQNIGDLWRYTSSATSAPTLSSPKHATRHFSKSRVESSLRSEQANVVSMVPKRIRTPFFDYSDAVSTAADRGSSILCTGVNNCSTTVHTFTAVSSIYLRELLHIAAAVLLLYE